MDASNLGMTFDNTDSGSLLAQSITATGHFTSEIMILFLIHKDQN
jgi:hypothetical protein